jgi:hypothetical protein
LDSVGGSLGVEYALLNWLGIGLSIGRESYSLVNARVFPAGFELGLLPVAILSGGSARASYINGELIYPFAVVDANDFDRITYGDLNVSLHPLGGEGVLDPYLKLIGGYGRTKADGFQALRYGGALGLRFFVTDWFYVVTEGAWINNDISGEVDTSVGIFESSSEFEGNLVDVQARLGFGFAF